ncbi:MAG: peptidylprolyl isomerase [Clostridia bacterium]|nr:peptidylprolyl isomerase [Clostridia bacterium]
MDIKNKNLKAGNENGIIIAILAILLVLVLVIVGTVVLKDNAAVAKFDGGKVTKKEYQVYYEMFSSYLKSYGYDSNSIPEEILLKAAQDKMIVTDAKKAGVKLSKEDKKEVDEIFSNEEYINYFKENYDFSIDTLRQIYYNDYIIQAYIKKLATETEDAKIEEYIKNQYAEGETIDMNEYDTSHILFSFTKDDGTSMTDEEKANLKATAEGVLARAVAGEDFAALAKEYSDDDGTVEGDNPGQYKMYMDGNTVQEYSDAVKSMKPGEVKATLVETAYGYHIIKLNAVNENGRVKSETVREQYANTLFDNIVEDKHLDYDLEAFKKYVKSIDADAYSAQSATDTDTATPTDGQVINVDENGNVTTGE